MKLLKKALPHIVAIVIFAAISAIFFAPQFSGKALGSHDMMQYSGMGQDIKEHVEQFGEHPQWAGRMFSGMPAYLIDMNYDGRYVKNVADYAYFLGQPAAFLFIAMVTFYLMLLMFGVNPWIGIIGGIAYGLSTYFPIIISAGHITKMMALAWIPALIGAIYYAYNKNRWLGAALAGVFASIEISTSHPQILYYFIFVILALVINEFVKAYKTKVIKSFFVTSAVLLLAGGLAVGSNAVQLYYVADHSAETTRGKSELRANEDNGVATGGLDKDYATEWSYGIGESFNMFIPRLLGQGSSSGFDSDGEVAKSLEKYQAKEIAPQLPSYWGDQLMTEGGVYIGAIMVFLFVLAMFVLKGAQKWWIFGAMVLALILAWGRNAMWLTDLFLDYMPLYNKFRTPSMILVVLELCIPLLGVLALQSVFTAQNDQKPQIVKGIKWALGICGGFAIFVALILPSFVSFTGANDGAMGLPEDVIGAMMGERESMMKSDAWRTLAFVVIAAGALWAYLKGWIKPSYAIAGLAIIVTIDMFSVDKRFVSESDFKPKKEALAILPTEVDKQIMQDTTNFRVANFTKNPFSDATTSYFHRSIGGYHAAKLRRYQDLIDRHLAKQNMAVYDMLNTKYFITNDGLSINQQAAGNAWFVDSVRFVANPNEEIDALEQNFNPRQVAIVDRRFETMIPQKISADSTANIQLVDYKVNKLVYQYEAVNEGVVVFSEIYFKKGWVAKIDGVESDYFRSDYVLRAMVVPAGKHTIEWTFKAPNYGLVVNVTRICSILLLLGSLFLIIFTAVKERNNSCSK